MFEASPPPVPALTPPLLSLRRIAACSGQTELRLSAPPLHPLRPLLASPTLLPPPPSPPPPSSRFLLPLVLSGLPSPPPPPPRPPLSLRPLRPLRSVGRRLVVWSTERAFCFSRKRKQLLPAETPTKRSPRVTLRPEQNNKTVILFEASMEFLENTNADDDDEDDEDASSFVTAPALPTFPPVAVETLPMRYDHTRREEQAAVVAMGGRMMPGRFDSTLEDYYTLRLRALSDGVLFDTIFLPRASSASPSALLLPHSNTWTSILSHGAFASHTPPPSPGDLIAMASQLTNQRLVCILEACHLGGALTELVLSRAFQLTS